jgi:hypothetical protein
LVIMTVKCYFLLSSVSPVCIMIVGSGRRPDAGFG